MIEYVRCNYLYSCGTVCLTRHAGVSSESPLTSRSTSRASSTRSATRNSARFSPRTISGSGATRSVHCGGTEQTVSSSTRSSRRLPYRLYRSATHTNSRPLSGWNGCVTRTRPVTATESPAFWIELQTARDWVFCQPLVRRCRRRGADNHRAGPLPGGIAGTRSSGTFARGFRAAPIRLASSDRSIINATGGVISAPSPCAPTGLGGGAG